VVNEKLVLDGVTQGNRIDAAISKITGYLYNATLSKKAATSAYVYCNMLSGIRTHANGSIQFVLDASVTGATDTDSLDDVCEKMNAVIASWYEAGTPLEVVYELANPYTIQLTPQQLSTLKGMNNVWSDCGSTELSYIADTKLYIDKKIAAIAAALLEQ
jgi:hypothetical protein